MLQGLHSRGLNGSSDMLSLYCPVGSLCFATQTLRHPPPAAAEVYIQLLLAAAAAAAVILLQQQ